jgi:hypothetical protein
LNPMKTLKALNLLLSFLLELAMLAALAVFGIHSGKNGLNQWVLGLSLAALAAVLWGVFAAPKSKRRLRRPARLLFALLLFGLSDAALYAAGEKDWAVVLAVAGLINLSLAALWKQ